MDVCTGSTRREYSMSAVQLLPQPEENKYVCSSCGPSSFLQASLLVPCLTWVQCTVWTVRHLGLTDLILWPFNSGELFLTVVLSNRCDNRSRLIQMATQEGLRLSLLVLKMERKDHKLSQRMHQPLEARPGKEINCYLWQQSSTFLAPGTSFMEDSFFHGLVKWGMVWGWFKHNRVHAPMRI